MFDSEKFSRWVGRKAMAYMAWNDHRAKARLEKPFNNHHTLEICVALCVILLALGLINHQNAMFLRSLCELAMMVVFLKFVQLIMIALHRTGKSDE